MIVAHLNDCQPRFALARRVEQHTVVQLLDDDSLANLQAFGVNDHPWSFHGVVVTLAVCLVHSALSGALIMFKWASGVKGVMVGRLLPLIRFLAMQNGRQGDFHSALD